MNSLKLVKIKIFKTYIEINLVNDFIKSPKFFAKTLISFVKKPN